MRISVRKLVLSLGLGASVVAVSACDPGSVSTGGSVATFSIELPTTPLIGNFISDSLLNLQIVI